MPTATATKSPAQKAPAKAAGPVKKATAPKAVTPDTTELEKAAIHDLRLLIAADTKRTMLLKKFALGLVRIRQELNDPAGTSQAYRDAAARIYAAATIPPDSESSLQASIRYHIGNVLRDEFKPEELKAVGLSTQTPLERARAARTAGGTAPTTTPSTPEVPTLENGPVEVKVLPDSVVLAPINPPQAGRRKEKRDYTERPRPQIALPPNPVVLVGHALDIVRAAASIQEIPATDVASLRDMSRRVRAELDHLEARLASIEATPTSKAASRAAAKKAS